MAEWQKASIKTIAICVGATLAVLGVGLFLFAASGIYSVAASRSHFAVTRWMLEFAMRRSVATHSYSISPPPLQDADKVRLGAGHYDGGCAPCHGAPGKRNNPIVRQMLPHPPNLSEAVATWAPEELYRSIAAALTRSCPFMSSQCQNRNSRLGLPASPVQPRCRATRSHSRA